MAINVEKTMMRGMHGSLSPLGFSITTVTDQEFSLVLVYVSEHAPTEQGKETANDTDSDFRSDRGKSKNTSYAILCIGVYGVYGVYDAVIMNVQIDRAYVHSKHFPHDFASQ